MIEQFPNQRIKKEYGLCAKVLCDFIVVALHSPLEKYKTIVRSMTYTTTIQNITNRLIHFSL